MWIAFFLGVENYNENGINLVVLFIKNLDLNVTKFKGEFVIRGGRNQLMTYNADLMNCQGVHFLED